MSIAYVNGATNGAFSTNVSLSGIGAGNLLVMWGRFFGAGTPTFTDAGGNIWVLGGSFANGSSTCAMWYCLSAVGTVNANFSGAGTFPEIVIEQFSASGGGVWTLGGSPTTGTGSQSSGNWSAGAQTVTVGDLVLGLFENETTNGIGFGNAGGFTYHFDCQGNAVMTDKVAASTSETPQVGSNTTATVGWMSANFTASAPASASRRISFID